MKTSIVALLPISLMVLAPFVHAVEVENRAPIANADSYTTGVNEALVTLAVNGVLSNDTDDDADALVAELVTGPATGTLVFNSDGSFTYTPVTHYDGSDSFSYKVGDGHATSSANVDIIISLGEDVPYTLDDEYSTNEDTVLTVDAAAGVLANDVDPNSLALTAVLESDVNDGTLTLNADGSFVYTPDADYNGMESFTYRAFNGSFYGSTRTAVINVAPVEDSSDTTDNNGGGNEEAESGSSGGRSGGHSFRRTTGGSGGEVLGTSTDLPQGCTALFEGYLKMGGNNDMSAVIKLQNFLNTHMNAGLPVSGLFGPMTFEAVKAFQLKHSDEVLKPWVAYGLPSDKTPTGYVYKTTSRWINLLHCSSLTLPMPQLP